MMRKISAVMLLVLLTLSAAQANWEIDDEMLDLPPPPKSGSRGEERDYKIMLQLQESRTDEECKEADRQSSASLPSLFGPRTGLLTAEEFAEVEEFGGEVMTLVVQKGDGFKKKWMRKRPYDVNDAIQPCIRKPGGQRSYPSSHAAIGVVMGDLLAKLHADRAEAFHEQGLKIGRNRVLGGVHHPSDIEAGQLLGRQIRDELMKNAEFRRDFKKLQH